MGQKVSPNVLRIGIIRSWDNRWYAEKQEYVKWLHQDIKIRQAVLKKLRNAAVSKIEIERTKKEITLVIRSARPAIVLGQEGKNVENIVLIVKKAIHDKKAVVKVKVIEIKNPDVDARLVAQFIGEQITNRASFRTVQKLAIRKALKAGAKGIKTAVSGRLGGVDMARTEGYLEGSVPLSTLRSDIDYALYEARTTYGQIGVKVWINHGEILGKGMHNRDSKVIEEKKTFKKVSKGG
ncbi:30S ribosomal protein S3 [Spiroplasma turonicum]|uniref:Small ribosomal subunit protein uS3 n=1 Tax=Spiroplasma turonicum TaxID=216946 RepID=A0A0K1P7J4_9MOLU|nr:30S ribosomal protein S3 [Spiroplasma turonicum]AKU80263.1 30S ribosomal protein S3 [Spiroplasma turonicum]ALX71264.1 30S ribosomal protein S3 [Spiroplasma turonicum]